jgi:dTDP-4-amino-4,6-dideoxygalactose transaminase
MQVPLLDLKAQYSTIREQIRQAVDSVLESQRFILGPNVAALETEIGEYLSVPYVVAVASGTDALLLSLRAAGVGAGDSVVTVPYTFFATAGTIVNIGARPLFVDIDRSTYNMDPERLSSFLARDCTFNLTTQQLSHKASNTTIKAVIPVHLYGQCADMDEIAQIAGMYQLPVIEDACQAMGATYKGRRAGALGDLGCFSFFPSKNLGGAGDGGVIVSRDKKLGDLVRLLRGHGAHTKYHHKIVGFNSRLDELQAAILRVKLSYLEQWNDARSRNAALYAAGFQDAGLLDRVALPAAVPDRAHIFHQYVIRCRRRDELKTFLQCREIGCEVYYPVPLHEQECFQKLGYTPYEFPNSRAASRETLALPIYPELAEGQIAWVVGCIAEFYATTPQA